MRIKMRYDNQYQTFEVEVEELERWLNISISEEESQEDYESRIQKEINIRFNYPDYNSWHKQSRHKGYAVKKDKEGNVNVNSDEAIMAKSRNQEVYTDETEVLLRRLDYEKQYKYYCGIIRANLKSKAAEMVIAIVLDGKSVGEYADLIGDTPNNVSHRYRRAIKKLQKVFKKRPFGLSLVANKYEGDTLNGKGGK